MDAALRRVVAGGLTVVLALIARGVPAQTGDVAYSDAEAQLAAGTESTTEPVAPRTSAPAGDVGAISGNAAVNIVTGTGRLGDWLGVNHDGWRLGGLAINDANGLLSGGLGPGKWVGQSLTVADLSYDTEKAGHWDGGSFGTQFLYYTGYGAGPVVNGVEQHQGSPNSLAGTVMGFNSLDGAPPIHRAELYQAWYRQTLFDDLVQMRIGKSVPTYDFNNVTRPVATADEAYQVPSVSGAILTPIYVNPTMLGVIPGYYNSATGVITSITPTEHLYAQYGFYDGSLATGRQTGLEGPHFTGHYLHLAEVGATWFLGPDKLPGSFGIGGWAQTGTLRGFSGQRVDGAQGMYLFGSQRLYFEDPGRTHDGLSFFYQFGATDADVVLTQRYFGCGLTYFGPLPNRSGDSLGFALALGKMNSDPNAGKVFYSGYGPGPAPLGSQELMMTWYYQIDLEKGRFLQPNLSYIPDPARIPGTPSALALTIQAVLLF